MERNKWFDGGVTGYDLFNYLRVDYFVIPKLFIRVAVSLHHKPRKMLGISLIVTRERIQAAPCLREWWHGGRCSQVHNSKYG